MCHVTSPARDLCEPPPTSAPLAKHAHAPRPIYGYQPPPRADFVVDPLQVPFHGALDEAQPLTDFRVAQSIANQGQDLDLARRQTAFGMRACALVWPRRQRCTIFAAASSAATGGPCTSESSNGANDSRSSAKSCVSPVAATIPFARCNSRRAPVSSPACCNTLSGGHSSARRHVPLPPLP